MAVPRFGRLQRILAAALYVFTPARPIDASGDDSWAPDDLAERIGTGHWVATNGSTSPDPVAGHVDIVRAVRLSQDSDGRYRVYLIFSRWPNCMFDARAFRRLTPRADAARAADAAFVNQLKGRTFPSPPAPSIAARLKRILS